MTTKTTLFLGHGCSDLWWNFSLRNSWSKRKNQPPKNAFIQAIHKNSPVK